MTPRSARLVVVATILTIAAPACSSVRTTGATIPTPPPSPTASTVTSTGSSIGSDGSTTTAATTAATEPGTPSTSTTSTTVLPGPIDSTTLPHRTLYAVSGEVGVFPVSGQVCGFDIGTSTLASPAGATIDLPDDPGGPVPYAAEIRFTPTNHTDGQFTFSITAYATSFTGAGTYTINWLGSKGLMDLYESKGSAQNQVVDKDDTSDMTEAFSVSPVGSC